MNLSKNFTLDQMTKSQTASRAGLKEQFSPSPEIVGHMTDLCVNVLEKVLNLFPNVQISSGYRSPALNAMIGGVNSSRHTKGEAADLILQVGSNIEIAKSVLAAKIPFDQMIIEFGTLEKPDWVHLSYKMASNRYQILRAEHGHSGPIYTVLTSDQVKAIK